MIKVINNDDSQHNIVRLPVSDLLQPCLYYHVSEILPTVLLHRLKIRMCNIQNLYSFVVDYILLYDA